MTTIVITDTTPTATVREVCEARTRRLMAERVALPAWGDGRRARVELLDVIDDALDEFNLLT